MIENLENISREIFFCKSLLAFAKLCTLENILLYTVLKNALSANVGYTRLILYMAESFKVH